MNLPFTATVQQQVRNSLSDQADITESQREGVRDIEQRVDSMLADFAEQKNHIANNADRSAQGREKDLAALKQSMIERLRHITDAEVSQIAKRLGELEIQLQPQRPDTNPVVQEMREAEIRSLLRDKSELEVIASYQGWATEGGNDDAMRAIENAPSFAPLISDVAILDAGRRARAARQSPQAAETLKRLRQMQALLRNIIQSAEAQIDLPKDDMLAVIARGETEEAA